MSEHVVASADELADGERLVVELEGREIGVFKHDGEYYAYLNWCAHQSGPICEGILSGTTEATFDRESLELTEEWVKEGRILNCPWHGWEFDIVTGDCLSDEDTILPSYPVNVEKGEIVVTL